MILYTCDMCRRGIETNGRSQLFIKDKKIYTVCLECTYPIGRHMKDLIEFKHKHRHLTELRRCQNRGNNLTHYTCRLCKETVEDTPSQIENMDFFGKTRRYDICSWCSESMKDYIEDTIYWNEKYKQR